MDAKIAVGDAPPAKKRNSGQQNPDVEERASYQAPLEVPILAENATHVSLDADILLKNRVIGNVTTDEGSGAASYKMLRTRMLHQTRTNDWIRIAVASARRNAGKTLTAINTAISLSSEPNQRVILVDLDLRKPTLAQTLGFRTEKGLSDYLLNKVRIEDIVVRTDLDRLLIVPNYARIAESSEMLSSAKMKEFVHIVSSPVNSSIVLFDLPPLLETDDLLAFSPLVDALLMVVAEGETKRVDLQKSSDLIQELNIIGFVLNKSLNSDDVSGYYY